MSFREYMELFREGEKSVRCNVLEDKPWSKIGKIDPENLTLQQKPLQICLLSYCAAELFVPDNTTDGLCHAREIYGQSWFHLTWGYEEVSAAEKIGLTSIAFLAQVILPMLKQFGNSYSEFLKRMQLLKSVAAV